MLWLKWLYCRFSQQSHYLRFVYVRTSLPVWWLVNFSRDCAPEPLMTGVFVCIAGALFDVSGSYDYTLYLSGKIVSSRNVRTPPRFYTYGGRRIGMTMMTSSMFIWLLAGGCYGVAGLTTMLLLCLRRWRQGWCCCWSHFIEKSYCFVNGPQFLFPSLILRHFMCRLGFIC